MVTENVEFDEALIFELRKIMTAKSQTLSIITNEALRDWMEKNVGKPSPEEMDNLLLWKAHNLTTLPHDLFRKYTNVVKRARELIRLVEFMKDNGEMEERINDTISFFVVTESQEMNSLRDLYANREDKRHIVSMMNDLWESVFKMVQSKAVSEPKDPNPKGYPYCARCGSVLWSNGDWWKCRCGYRVRKSSYVFEDAEDADSSPDPWLPDPGSRSCPHCHEKTSCILSDGTAICPRCRRSWRTLPPD